MQKVEEDKTKFKCFACNATLSLTEAKQAIKRHSESQKHLERIKSKASQLSVSTMFGKMQSDKQLQTKIYDAEIRLSTFFATHNVAVSIVDDLVPLIKYVCTDRNVVQGK